MRKGRDGASTSQRTKRLSASQRVQAQAAAARIRERRKGKKLGGTKIKALIAEGRR